MIVMMIKIVVESEPLRSGSHIGVMKGLGVGTVISMVRGQRLDHTQVFLLSTQNHSPSQLSC